MTTSASIRASRSATSIGRPATTSTTHSIAPHTRSIAVRSAADSDRSARPLPTSPTPSALGVSPTTTTPTSQPLVGADAVREYVNDASGATSRIPSRIDVAPSVISPEPPCQVIVQPPAWLPSSGTAARAR
jgi:hypothetical protein